MTRHGNAQPELDEKALEAARQAARAARDELEYFGASEDFTRSPIEAAIRAYLLAAGGTGEREERVEAVRNALIEADEWARENETDMDYWHMADEALKALDRLASPSPVSPAGREERS